MTVEEEGDAGLMGKREVMVHLKGQVTSRDQGRRKKTQKKPRFRRSRAMFTKPRTMSYPTVRVSWYWLVRRVLPFMVERTSTV